MLTFILRSYYTEQAAPGILDIYPEINTADFADQGHRGKAYASC